MQNQNTQNVKKLSLLIAVLLYQLFSSAQNNFQIALETESITNLGGLQSYAFAQDNGKWLFIGGRQDGLHRRQPWASFDAAGNNNQLLVVDPFTKQFWTAPLSSLSTALQEQLSSTNMQFFQTGNYLYVIGGYGFSASANDHITYPKITAVKVAETIDAVINNTSISSYFRQQTNNDFAVTGGHLSKIYDRYYLVGGQKFTGRYNPMGGPTYVQVYTNAIRSFQLDDDGTTLTISNVNVETDAANLHRRDYNVTAQIMPNGQEGLTAFSGVFQPNADLPFLNCVNIDSSGYTVNNDFWQYYNHYHCANVPLYSEDANEMHSVFFGGIAQYYDSLGVLVQDNNVPFVKTVARVTRTANDSMKEYKMPVEMPYYLGASAEFIPLENLPMYANGVIKLDSLTADTTLIGYIFGGIKSSAKNIFFINNGTESEAYDDIIKVYVLKGAAIGIDELNIQSKSKTKMQIYPIPNNGILQIDFDLAQKSDVLFRVNDVTGKLIHEEKLESTSTDVGLNHHKIDLTNHDFGLVLFVTLETKKDSVTQKIILAD